MKVTDYKHQRPRTPRSPSVPAEQWEAFHGLIEDLYIRQNKTCDQVLEVLHHRGFNPS